MSTLEILDDVIAASKRDDYQRVVERTEEAIRRGVDTGPVILVYANALDEVGRTAEARELLERALSTLEPARQVLAFRLLGRLLEREGRTDEAVGYYERAIALMPENTVTYIYLGALHARSGRLSQAEALYARATQCAAGDLDEAWLNLGGVQLDLGRVADAEASFRRALQINPAYEDAREALARIERSRSEHRHA
jgi:protein O-GlcNAc transferase